MVDMVVKISLDLESVIIFPSLKICSRRGPLIMRPVFMFLFFLLTLPCSLTESWSKSFARPPMKSGSSVLLVILNLLSGLGGNPETRHSNEEGDPIKEACQICYVVDISHGVRNDPIKQACQMWFVVQISQGVRKAHRRSLPFFQIKKHKKWSK